MKGKVKQRIEERRIKVIKLHLENLSIPEISIELNVCQHTIYKDLIEIGLREKKNYSEEQREAISRGVKRNYREKKKIRDSNPVCLMCGKKAEKGRFRGGYYCGEHLVEAGNYDKNYIKNQRNEKMDRFASSAHIGE